MTVSGLVFDNLDVIGQGFLELRCEQIDLGSLVEIARFCWGQLYCFSQRLNRLFMQIKISVVDPEVVVDISLICFEWFIL